MFKQVILLTSIVFAAFMAQAQFPGMPQGGAQRGGAGGFGGEQMKVGRFYGKIIDAKTGKGLEFATVQLNGSKFDTISKSMKPSVLGGQITGANGDFSIDKLTPFGEFTLKISAIGYKPIEKKVKFDVKFELGKPVDYQKMLGAVDKDLGNFKLETSTDLKEVVVDGSEPSFRLDIDKKVFNVEKNAVSTGGTAEDVLKTVPSINVDLDGNVSLRNAAPQIFVDGRPSTLSLEQIPADAIQSVEVITNPSAKYDASGGNGGIINIVLKKNRKFGYNGGIRAGIDKRGKVNLGGDVNLRQDKLNFFALAQMSQRKSISTGYTARENLSLNPRTDVRQDNDQTSEGVFAFARFGVDYFLDNRNTISVSQSIVRGKFNPFDRIATKTDTISDSNTNDFSTSIRNSNSERTFFNLGTTVSYKHLFPKDGKEFTTDVNYNRATSDFTGDFNTSFASANGQVIGASSNQRQLGTGGNQFLTITADFVNPLTDKIKMESGVRAAFRTYDSNNENFFQNPITGEYIKLAAFTNDYKFNDQVLAAYTTFSQQIGKFSYQAGLRAESSDYTGTLFLSDTSSNKFKTSYPFNLFPSGFVTYQLSSDDDLQFSYTRRINRPNFFQLIPFTDYTDSLNLSRGNPGLQPEFTNSFELSYLNTINQKNNLLFSAYYKQTTGLITRFQVTENNAVLGRDVVISTYENANESYSYGLELTAKNTLTKWLDVTSNINVYNAVIDGGNISSNLKNEQLSWFGKLNASAKLPKSYSIQLTADYLSRTAVPPSGGSRGGSGGGGGFGGFGGGPTSTAQGYVDPVYGVDIAFKKDFQIKKNTASVTLSFSDIFRTRVNFAYSTAEGLFTQETFRRRDPQFIRLNFSYRFGKFDVSIFKRKNMKNMMEGMQDIQGAQ